MDYEGFFAFIAREPSQARRESIANRVVVVPTFTQRDGMYFFTAYSGSSDTAFLVLDLSDDSEEVRHIEEGKMIATRTVGVIDFLNRRAAIQYVHAGVRAAQIAALFEKLGQLRSEEYEGVTLEFAPLPGLSFGAEVARMERIQSATVTLTKPNNDWLDFSNAANGLASASGAQNIGVIATAPRNGTLLKSAGIVSEIVALTTRTGRSIVKAATIKGFRDDESALTTLNLSNHVEAKNLALPLGPDGLPNTASVTEAATAFLAATAVPLVALNAAQTNGLPEPE